MILDYIINKVIHLDPNINVYLSPLLNKTIAIICDDFPDKPIYCSFATNSIKFIRYRPANIDISITGPLLGFASVAIKKQVTDLTGNKITLTGDIHTATLVQQLILKLNIDWEEELSKYTGDVIAHQAILLLRKLRNHQQQTTNSLEEMLTEYLQEEARIFPTQYEITEFMTEVDHLRMRVDRLTKQLENYENT